MGKEHQKEEDDGSCYPAKSDTSRASNASLSSLESDLDLPTCRVCQCVESDKRGDVVLGFLGIVPPVQASDGVDQNPKPGSKEISESFEGEPHGLSSKCEDGRVEFVSPEGEVFVCNADLELGQTHPQDALIELGCLCKNDLALVHYACGLKWFINHGSIICEICGHTAANIRSADFKKVLASLKDYEALREMTAIGVHNPPQLPNSCVDPDVVSAIRRQRLSEISLWFNPHNNNQLVNNNNVIAVTEMIVQQPANFPFEINVIQTENPATKWAVEGTGILLATGLLTITLAWLIAPRVGKKTATNGLHILLGGVCALAVVVIFRFIVLTRIRYGPARYWAILFVFWFLVFGIWASRIHGAHTA